MGVGAPEAQTALSEQDLNGTEGIESMAAPTTERLQELSRRLEGLRGSL